MPVSVQYISVHIISRGHFIMRHPTKHKSSYTWKNVKAYFKKKYYSDDLITKNFCNCILTKSGKKIQNCRTDFRAESNSVCYYRYHIIIFPKIIKKCHIIRDIWQREHPFITLSEVLANATPWSQTNIFSHATSYEISSCLAIVLIKFSNEFEEKLSKVALKVF